MIKDTPLPLDSYRLASYSVQIPCYICEEGNTFDAEVCRYCQAPMALAHQANTQKIHPNMLATIGASGVGKTVYLGMLMDMLSRQPDRIQVLARGAFSINLQHQTTTALARCEFPSKTPNEPDRWNWVHCQIRARRQRRPLEVIMPDMAGEALLAEVDHPFTFPVIRSFMTKCTGALILIDTTSSSGDSHNQDFFAMKLLSYLAELDSDPKHGWPIKPVALIFSKADECEECFDNPNEYARLRTPGLWQLARERFKLAEFFAAGVAGACAQRILPDGSKLRVPLRIEPRGITEPFEWLVQRIKN